MEREDAGTRQQRVARAMKLARRRYGTMRHFSADLRDRLGWPSLSPAAVYAWESGLTRIPAVALVAACELASVSLDDLLASAANGADELTGDREAPSLPLAIKVSRLEDRVQVLERLLPG